MMPDPNRYPILSRHFGNIGPPEIGSAAPLIRAETARDLTGQQGHPLHIGLQLLAQSWVMEARHG